MVLAQDVRPWLCRQACCICWICCATDVAPLVSPDWTSAISCCVSCCGELVEVVEPVTAAADEALELLVAPGGGGGGCI